MHLFLPLETSYSTSFRVVWFCQPHQCPLPPPQILWSLRDSGTRGASLSSVQVPRVTRLRDLAANRPVLWAEAANAQSGARVETTKALACGAAGGLPLSTSGLCVAGWELNHLGQWS